MRKSCRENEWRDLLTHGLIGLKAAPASLSHVVRNGAAGSRVVRRVTRMTDSRSGRELDVGIAGPPSVTFVAGLPAVDEFPIAVWERLREQVLAKKGAHLLRY